MAKLKCNTHKRRVVQGERNWIHRNGDGSPCSGAIATIGTQSFSIDGAHNISVANAVKN